MQDRLARLDAVLRQVPYQYENRDRLRNDVANLLKTTHTLQPAQQQFEGGGRKVTLFYLFGVLPINFKGATYNIPVTIYFDPPYPRGPPRCFVTPSQGMALKAKHPHVDTGGMITVPYLNSWTAHNSSLAEMTTIISSVFSANPPVYATQGAPAASSTAQATPQLQQPTPGSQGLFGGLGQALGGMFGGGQPAQPAQPVQPVVQPVQPVAAQPVQRATAAQSTPVGAREALVAEATKGLKERWTLALEPVVDDLNAQVARKAELQAASSKIDEQIGSVRASAASAESDAAQLRQVEASLQSFLSQHGSDQPDPEALRESQDADTKQVLALLAEDLSLDEHLVALDELLAAKLVSLEDFLREVREVGRRQFMCRVQRQKAAAAVTAAHGAPAVVAC